MLDICFKEPVVSSLTPWKMPPPSLGKLIASYGEVPGGPWLNADALGVPRGPCRMCKSCPGLPGGGLLYWPQLSDDLEPAVRPPGLSSSRCRRCECPAHQHQNLELWLMDVKRRAKQIRFVSASDAPRLTPIDSSLFTIFLGTSSGFILVQPFYLTSSTHFIFDELPP